MIDSLEQRRKRIQKDGRERNEKHVILREK